MPQENLPGSSCMMNAAEILFLRVWEALFGEEQHSSGNGNQTAAPCFLLSGSCMLSVPGRIREHSVTYCVTECAAV